MGLTLLINPLITILVPTGKSGIGAYIQADVGSVKNICGVSIAWFNGDSRQYIFIISTSKDGINYQYVYRGISSGYTLQPENYRFYNTDARYVKITVFGIPMILGRNKRAGSLWGRGN